MPRVSSRVFPEIRHQLSERGKASDELRRGECSKATRKTHQLSKIKMLEPLANQPLPRTETISSYICTQPSHTPR
uniref:Uncharacterized protein n=1 Tax=Oryza brachyantha TaxID=4533 RepID=J3MEJ4_ORYBR